MIARPFGTTGREVPVIGQGTWRLRDPDRARNALALGIDLGMTHIDTAELYRGAEEAIAPVIRDRREEIFLVSKVLPSNSSERGTIEACERSLSRLKTDYLDVYLLHWWSDSHGLDETMAGMRALLDAGKVRNVGVSNFDVDELRRAQRALGPRHKIACDQVLYHLGDRGIEHELVPYCAREGIAVVAYSPFGSGRFPPGGRSGRETLDRIAARHGKTPAQVALNFLTRDESVFAIPKAEDPSHVRENAESVGWALSERDVGEIDAAFPARVGPLGML